MNVIPFAAPGRFSGIRGEPVHDGSLDAAWMVLEAANDLGDLATIKICRRVIDANLTGTAASPSDLHIITKYFR
jgi:hypothetical protein